MTAVSGYTRDPATRAVINTRDEELVAYRSGLARAKEARELRRRVERLEARVDQLERTLGLG